MEQPRKTNSFVIKDVCDHWKNYTYHQRYLDALASIFAIEGPCAAVTYFDQTEKFYLSYNHSIHPSCCHKPQQVINKIESIKKCLNYRGDNKVLQMDSLLFLYLTYNVNLIDQLETAINESNKIIKKQNELAISIKDEISDFDHIGLKLSEQYEYIKQKEAKNQDLIEQIKGILFTIFRSIKDINKQKKFVDPDDVNEINSKISEDKELSGNERKILERYNLIVSSYKDLFSILIQVDQNDRSEDFFYLVKVLLRPYQDLEKVLYYSISQGIQIDLELVDNPNKSHAEANLAREFSYTPNLYIGVSKLCCGLCDYLLDDIYHMKHRGTHGTCDDGWNPPSIQFIQLFEDLKSKSIGLDQRTLNEQFSRQHRQLSSDDLQKLLGTSEESEFQFEVYKQALLAEEYVFGFSDEGLFI